MTQPKSGWIFSIFLLIVCSSLLFSGCGTSKGKLELTGFLETYEKLITEYTTSYDATDKQKKAEMVNEIEAMTAGWIEKRNKFSSDVTPQVMNDLSDQYNRITAKYTEFAKSHTG